MSEQPSDGFLASPIGKAVVAYGKIDRHAPGAEPFAMRKLREIERLVAERVAAERKEAQS
jgi:hypothetical protein